MLDSWGFSSGLITLVQSWSPTFVCYHVVKLAYIQLENLIAIMKPLSHPC